MNQQGIQDIFNVRVVDEQLITAGQPSEAQLASVAADGVKVVINLALHDDKRYSLPDEANLVHSLGMQYVHIPVVFEKPKPEQLQEFCKAMDEHRGEKILVHCAANYRVSAFVGMYRVLRLGWQKDEAFVLMDGIWKPDAIWQAFIDSALTTPPASAAS